MNSQKIGAGYTFVELVVVLALIGTLAAFVIPRFASQSQFDLVGFQQEFAAGLRYGQKYAFASGCPIRAVVASNGLELRRSATCDNGKNDKQTSVGRQSNSASLMLEQKFACVSITPFGVPVVPEV